jgi:hypothetical protein
MFPGNNTSAGFFSYYAHIMPQSEACRIFCLKGGPGVGKSTLMVGIAERLANEGYMLEYLHCSSDPNSLDGIAIPALRAAIIDGTAPHIIDPVNPGAVDEIVNLGEYWDAAGIRRHKDIIIGVNAEVGELFRRAYRYLAAAKCLMDDALAFYGAALEPAGIYAEADKCIEAHMPKFQPSEKPGRIRKMFASAITPLGVVNHIETLIGSDYTAYAVESRWGAGVTEMLSRISEAAVMRGMNVEHYYCPMDPGNRIDHLIIPALKLALVSRNRYTLTPPQAQAVIDMARYADTPGEPEFAGREFDVLLREALYTLNRAKVTHDEMEKYYIPHMYFAAVNQKAEEMFEAIMACAR